MSLNKSAIRSLAAGRPGDVRRQRAEPRGDSNELASQQHGRGHADHLVEGARQVNGDLAATFKNFDLSVQSQTRVRSLLFESHRGDDRRADIRRWR
jgi:hypothetical protein